MLLEREVIMITIANPEKYVAGLYERLSNENIELGNSEVIVTNEDEKESGSISTQKIFLRNFCKENNIKVYDDYTDDGVSGATFNRPAFNRMIKDIEDKKINLIAVKDLSRFGRLSSKISYYLEEFFIEKGVRFIAITDDIDTGHIETSEEMVQFKSFFNEWFLRDTSRKIRNGKRARAKEGKVMTIYPTYGYKKDPLDYNHYIIDQDIAPIVKKIFMFARKGKTPTEISKILSTEKALVPSEIVGNTHTRKDENTIGWNRNTVKRILQNVTYLGWVSNGNTKKINYKSKKTIVMPKEDRIIVKNMHTPIIDEETFNIVQDMIKSRTSTRVKTYDPKKVTVVMGPYIISGFAEDTFINIVTNGDGTTAVVGCDQEIVRTISPDSVLKTITLTLLQSSDSNDDLTLLKNMDDQSGAGIVPLAIKDLTGRTVLMSDQAWVGKKPDTQRGKQAQSLAWTIYAVVPEEAFIVGGHT